MSEQLHPMGPHHLPFYLAPGSGIDTLMVVMGIFLVVTLLWVGTLYWRLHSLPERMAHKSQKLQFEIVAVLGLLSLFTHMHVFWVIGLFLALIDIPDFGTPLRSIADSVEKIADATPESEKRCGTRSRARSDRRFRRSPARRKTRRKRSAAMFELMFCSLLTIVPDYLFRRYVQGKRFGKEITFFSVWYELRWGITGCLMLTVSLITMIFYFHPSTNNATLYFRTDADRARGSWPRGRGECRLQPGREAGRCTVQAGQLQATGGGGNQQAQGGRG